MTLRLLLSAILLLCPPAQAAVEVGVASMDDGRPTPYDGGNFHGQVSTGERFRPGVLAIAHRTRRLGSWVWVRHGHLSQFARVWDRGPCLSSYCRSHAPRRVQLRIADLTPRLADLLRCDNCQVEIWDIPLP